MSKHNPTRSKGFLFLATAFLCVVLVFIFFARTVTPSKQQASPTPEVVVLPTPEPVATTTPPLPTTEPPQFPYIEIVDGCGPYYAGGVCVNMRSGPGTEHPVVKQLRTGVVLKVAETVTNEKGEQWHKIAIDKYIRYPERVETDWYVSNDVVELIYDDGDHRFEPGKTAVSTKRIIVDLSEETLYAYDGDELFMQELVSTGRELSPTPQGTFIVFQMMPSRYMQGPLPGQTDEYDLPGVPWNLYFTAQGAVIHGAYWHDKFGQPWSHGCVNLPLEKAKELYLWADIGTRVIVQD